MLKKIAKVLTTAGLLISLISAEVLPGAVYAENGAPITAEASETTGIAETPEVSGTPGTSETPEVTEAPETPKEAEASKASEGTDAKAGAAAKKATKAAEAAETSDESLCFIQNARIDSVKDGTAPFDKNNEIGNDADDENNIVRSFDYINYNIEYTTGLIDITQTVDSANVRIKAVLDKSTKEAEFNVETLNWCLDRKITYFYEDRSASTSYDKNKNVVKQVLTGYRRLENNSQVNNIPGTGSLTLGVYVKASQNGSMIKPEVSLWTEGNSEDRYQKLDMPVTVVSAAPKYNVDLRRSGGMSSLGYYNTDTGAMVNSSDRPDGDSWHRGRLERYSLALQLYNDSADKGLKGIEFPQGDITYDLVMKSEVNGTDTTSSNDFAPVLWDYKINMEAKYGTLGRDMQPYGAVKYAWYGPLCNGLYAYDIYNAGKIQMEQDAAKGNVYHVTVRDYEFDYENLHFPIRYKWSNYGDVNYSANIGNFSCGDVEVLAQLPESVDRNSNVYLDVSVNNFKATSISDNPANKEVKEDDNRSRTNVNLTPYGWINKYQRYLDSKRKYLSSDYNTGDNVAYKGNDIYIESFIHGAGETSWTAFNLLQKIDDEAIDITGKYDVSYSFTIDNGTLNVLYGAKKDKTGWTDDQEMQDTREEGLVYFKSVEDLKRAGYTCVAILYELRDMKTAWTYAGQTYANMHMRATVKTDSQAGSVYQAVSDLRVWNEYNNTMSFSYSDVPYNSKDKSYGLVTKDDPIGNIEGYTKPNDKLYSNYIKTSYKDGVMSGHNGYWNGNSLLVIGYKSGVKIDISDKTENASGVVTQKSVYDLDNGERTVSYKVSPSLKRDSANNDSLIANPDYYTDLTVKVDIPKGLTYDIGSATTAPESVVQNEDGSQTVTWLLKNQKVGETLDTFDFTCTIGKAGTAEDVRNNESFKVTAVISGKDDKCAQSAANGNLSSVSMSVIRLASTSISKRAEKPLAETGDDLKYTLYYSNTSTTDIHTSKIADILPYNNDGRGTGYSGDYLVKSVAINYKDAQSSFGKKDVVLAYSNKDYGVNDVTKLSEMSAATLSPDWTKVSETKKENNVIRYDNINKEARALFVDIGFVAGNSYLKIDVTLTPKKDGKLMTDGQNRTQQPGDVYVNSFAQNSDEQASIVYSNAAPVRIVKRNISGLVWVDLSRDGIRQDSESRMAGVKVDLYRLTPSGFDAAGQGIEILTKDGRQTVYRAYNALGNKIASISTDEQGNYAFEDLEAGDYVVYLESLNKYFDITLKNAGTNTDIDSDAYGVKNSSGIVDRAYIGSIKLDSADKMVDYLYESTHNDVGLSYRLGSIEVHKTDNDNNSLKGVGYQLYSTDAQYSQNAAHTYKGEKYYLVKGMKTGADGVAKFEDVSADGSSKYIIIENKTVAGQTLLKDPIDIGTLPMKVLTSQMSPSYDGLSFVDGEYTYCYDITYDISDGAVLTAPKTGYKGHLAVTLGIAGLGLALIVLKKKKSEKEN